MTRSVTADAITKASKSNLALALIVLPREIRSDMTSFYAFCRIVDDIADEPAVPAEKRRAQLDEWLLSLDSEFEGEPPLASEVRSLIAKYRIPVEYFREIITGVGMDIDGARYRTFEELRLYCYRVASAVGLVSIEIFGYTDPACKKYAEDLGLALQLTNIIRDVGEDWANGGRVYLPIDEVEQFGCSIEDIAAGRQTDAFHQLMQFQAARAREFYASAAAELPPRDARKMAAAELMHRVYKKLLDKMEHDGFRVLEQRYSLGKLGKIAVIAPALLSSFLNRQPATAVSMKDLH